MPMTTVTEISLRTAGGNPGAGLGAVREFEDFLASPFRVLTQTDGSSPSTPTDPAPNSYEAYLKKKQETQEKVLIVAAVFLLIVVVVLIVLLVKKSSGKKVPAAAPGAPAYGGAAPPAAAPAAPGLGYDMKDMEIDRKDKELERKEMELERKEGELEKERERRQKLTSKYEAERAGLEREIEGRKDETRRMQEERDKLRHELDSLQSQHENEMRLIRDDYDSKAAEVRKRFEEQLSEFETSQKRFWPEVFQEARTLSRFCECVKDSFADGSKTAAALYAELVSLGSRLGDMQAFVNQVSPLGKALYAWIHDTGRTGDQFDALLAEWLTEKMSGVELKVVAVKKGDAYNSAIHDCAKVGGNSVSKVLSFLILGKSNRTELKSIVEVG